MVYMQQCPLWEIMQTMLEKWDNLLNSLALHLSVAGRLLYEGLLTVCAVGAECCRG